VRTPTARTPIATAIVAFATLALLLASCAPVTQAPLPASDAAHQVDRTAEIVFHRMAIGYLESGSYTTNVLVDVTLPTGARWTLETYAQDGSSYRLRITSSQVPGLAWLVSPAGVRRITTP
jgi:hypothetical protein